MKLLQLFLHIAISAAMCGSPASAMEFAIVGDSRQDVVPYRITGAVIDENDPRWEDYKNLLARFPEVSTCFRGETAGTLEPENFAWTRFNGDKGAAVCLFRTAVALKDPIVFNAFLRELGFDSKITQIPDAMRLSGDPEIFSVSGSWSSASGSYPRLGVLFYDFGTRFVANRFSAGCYYDEELNWRGCSARAQFE